MIHCFPTITSLAHELSLYVGRCITQSLTFKDRLNIALSGGSTPSVFFDALAGNTVIEWSKLHFYWADERCVQPEHPDSNFGMTYKHLFSKIVIESSNIHRIAGENDPHYEAERYANEIKSNVAFKNGLPEFDLVLLGVGNDGHTASLFPDRPDLLKSQNLCATVKHPQSGQSRITLTGGIILNAMKLVFLVAGSTKQGIIKEILQDQGSDVKYPAAYIHSHHSDREWFIDHEAAATLKHTCHGEYQKS